MPTVLGRNLDAKIELISRKRKAATAFNLLWKLWLRGLPVSIPTKIKVYNGPVLPFFTQNSGAIAFRKVELDKLDSLHRSQLRRLIEVFYPEHIINRDLYDRTKTTPISTEIRDGDNLDIY